MYKPPLTTQRKHSSDRITTSSVTILIKVQNPKDFAEERKRSSTPQGEGNVITIIVEYRNFEIFRKAP